MNFKPTFEVHGWWFGLMANTVLSAMLGGYALIDPAFRWLSIPLSAICGGTIIMLLHAKWRDTKKPKEAELA